jgi:hypothetical protein
MNPIVLMEGKRLLFNFLMIEFLHARGGNSLLERKIPCLAGKKYFVLDYIRELKRKALSRCRC